MGTPMQNKIVTRGFGVIRSVPNSSGPITQGYGPLVPTFVVVPFVRPRVGQSGLKRRLRELDEIIVWAKLITVNDVEPKRPIKGLIHVRVSKDRNFAAVMAEHVATRVRKAWETITVTVTRLK